MYSDSYASNRSKVAEDELKAVFIKSLIKHVSWPASKDKNDIKICIFGNSPIISYLNGLNTEIKYKNSYIDDCHILYFGTYSEANLSIVLKKTFAHPILTIGSSDNFAKKSGIIQFNITGKRVILKINKKSLNQSEIEISPTLLEMSESL